MSEQSTGATPEPSDRPFAEEMEWLYELSDMEVELNGMQRDDETTRHLKQALETNRTARKALRALEAEGFRAESPTSEATPPDLTPKLFADTAPMPVPKLKPINWDDLTGNSATHATSETAQTTTPETAEQTLENHDHRRQKRRRIFGRHSGDTEPTIRRKTALKLGALALSVGVLLGGFMGTRNSSAPERERAETVPVTLSVDTFPTTTSTMRVESSTTTTTIQTASEAIVASPEFKTMNETIAAHPEWSEQDVLNVLNLAAMLESQSNS